MIEFTAKVIQGNKIVIPKWLAESADIQVGDVVKIALLHKVVVELKEAKE